MKNALYFPFAAPLAAFFRKLASYAPPSLGGIPASPEHPFGAAAGLPNRTAAIAPGGPPQPEAAP